MAKVLLFALVVGCGGSSNPFSNVTERCDPRNPAYEVVEMYQGRTAIGDDWQVWYHRNGDAEYIEWRADCTRHVSWKRG